MRTNALRLFILPLLASCAFVAPHARGAAEEPPMQSERPLSLQVREVLHYCADVEASLRFYRDKLGWGVISHGPGGVAEIDAGGAYQVVLVAARWMEGWEAGQPVPPPLLSLQSYDLEADLALLRERGLGEVAVAGDPEQMLYASIPFVEGLTIFAWQDNTPGEADNAVADHSAKGSAPLYALGELDIFADDKQAAVEFLTAVLGFQTKFSHGNVYTALSIDDGPLVGVFDLPTLLEEPVFSPGGARTRLFFECADIAAEHARQAAGAASPGELIVAPDGLKWFSTADPDGNLLTFWQYDPPEPGAGE